MKKRWLVAVSLVLVLFLVGVGGCTFSPGEGISPSGLKISLNGQSEGRWVNGQGEVTVIPDVATLRMGSVAQEASVAEAQAKASAAMDNLITALKDGGVAKKDIQPHFFNIQKVTRWDRARKQELVIG